MNLYALFKQIVTTYKEQPLLGFYLHRHRITSTEKFNRTDPIKTSSKSFAIIITFYTVSFRSVKLNQTKCCVSGTTRGARADRCGRRRRQSQTRSMTAHSRHPTCFYVGGRLNS